MIFCVVKRGSATILAQRPAQEYPPPPTQPAGGEGVGKAARQAVIHSRHCLRNQ